MSRSGCCEQLRVNIADPHTMQAVITDHLENFSERNHRDRGQSTQQAQCFVSVAKIAESDFSDRPRMSENMACIEQGK
ncbi:MAG: hypothetical protein QM589_15750 [Thermomicrobiales bacterium]